MALDKTGTIMYWVVPTTPGWEKDDQLYKFQTPAARTEDGIRVDTQKHPDGTLRVWVFGPSGVLTHFRVPLPELQTSPAGHPGIHVSVTWENSEVKLYLNSQLVQTKQV